MLDNQKPINPELKNLIDRFARIRVRFTHRDTRMGQVQAIRAGKMSEVAPDLFPQSGPWQEPIVANMIDVAARDMGEMIAPLPSFNCTSPTMTTDRERERASLKTKVALGYAVNSNLQVQMLSAGDQYVTYGFLPMRVEIDYDSQMPVIRTIDPIGTYPEQDRFNRLIGFWQRTVISRDELMAQYPEFASDIKEANGVFGGQTLELIFHHDKNFDTVFINAAKPVMLSRIPNPLGKVMIRIAQRPGISNIPRGQFDDVIFVQLAKARFALLALQAAHKTVTAPLVVPSDVPEIPQGPDATIRTNNPAGVRRVPLDISPVAFQEQASLERELQLGSRFPSVRTGNADSSIVTGKGVQALMGGYDSQIRTHQAVFADTFREIMGLCFEIDEKLFGSVEKELRGSQHGTPFEVKYVPAKTIKGDYTVDVTYGLMAGLDPNRWLVFALQARAEKMFSRDFMRREMPIDLDPEQQRREIDIEDMEEAAKQALMGYAQSIPALAAQGQDPSGPLMALAKVIADRRSGKPLADSVVEALTPKKEEAPEMSPEEQMAQMLGGGGQPQGGLPEGMMASGLMQGVAPGQAGMAPGGRPDLNTMLAGLSASGQPNLSATVSRRNAV
jgi:hypothetical protein